MYGTMIECVHHKRFKMSAEQLLEMPGIINDRYQSKYPQKITKHHQCQRSIN